MTQEDVENLSAFMVGIMVFWAPLVGALTELVKRIRPSLPNEAYPVLTLAFGLAVGFFYLAPTDPRMGALYGVAIALTSAGLYSGGKAVIGKS